MANTDRVQPSAPHSEKQPQASVSQTSSTEEDLAPSKDGLNKQFQTLADELTTYIHEQRDATNRLLVALKTQRADKEAKESLPGFLVVLFLRVIGTATAIVFGAFAILSWQDAQKALQQAEEASYLATQQAGTANILALAALCAPYMNQTTSANDELQPLCAAFASRAGDVLSRTVEALIPGPTSSAAPPESDAQAGLGGPSQIAVGVGLAVGIFSLIVAVLSVWQFRRRRR